jgi:hypothetical protein
MSVVLILAIISINAFRHAPRCPTITVPQVIQTSLLDFHRLEVCNVNSLYTCTQIEAEPNDCNYHACARKHCLDVEVGHINYVGDSAKEGV